MLLETIDTPKDLRKLSQTQLDKLCIEIRDFVVEAATTHGGHLGSNLGLVELTIALHRSLDSPKDVILFDIGHQAYVHKLLTGRREMFEHLRQEGGLSGYPSREESAHDWIENSHASTVLGYAHGMATSFKATGQKDRRVVAVLGDGSLTGGMAYEGLNNLGHSSSNVTIILNDNGRSYAPTISKLSKSLVKIRSNPVYMRRQKRFERFTERLPLIGKLSLLGIKASKAAIREALEPQAFFETLGVRYIGPFNGHNIEKLEQALANAAEFDGPVVLHVMTRKGRGYAPAENDAIKNMHDMSGIKPNSFTAAFSESVVKLAEENDDVVAITAAMPDSTGLLPFKERFPDRTIDVGIAEQHAVTAAAGMAMGGLRPVVAIYSTFMSRAFDQANLDVGLHSQPVIFCLDRAGITGDDGPSHHGIFDLVLMSKISGMTIFCPSSYKEIQQMLHDAYAIRSGPCCIRWPKTLAPDVADDQVGKGLAARKVRSGNKGDAPVGASTNEQSSIISQMLEAKSALNKVPAPAYPLEPTVCFIGVGKMVHVAAAAAELLTADGIDATVWDPRVVKPLDAEMLADAANHELVVTIEDGLAEGGIGSSIALALADKQTQVQVMGLPTEFIVHNKPDAILASFGLDAGGVAAKARSRLGLSG